jgi:hypothetical protein
MGSKPQNGVAKRSRGWVLAVLMVVAGGLGAGEAWGDIQVHVMNCTASALEVQAFDAKDSVEAISASKKKFSVNQSGESESLHCAGEGKGFCQMIIVALTQPLGTVCDETDWSDGVGGSVQFHLESGKWAVVTGFEKKNDECKPVVQYDLDSASCN